MVSPLRSILLTRIHSKCSIDAGIVDTELARLKAIDNEREKAHKQKLKGKGRIYLQHFA